jgi:glycerol-3-phosphate cytidylyltransferase
MIIGYTTGVFDMFHIGHLNILKKSKSYCDYLIVGLTTDELCFKLKNKKPIISFKHRKLILQSCKYVNQVVKQKSIKEIKDLNKYKFNIIFKGSDWKNTTKWKKLKKQFKDLNVEVKFFNYTKNISSTKLRKVC